jgi:hypothetical protein
MLFERARPSLVNEAWEDFTRRLRWKIFFLQQETDDQPYDPDYEFDDPLKVKKWAGDLQPYFEKGIAQGQTYVNEYIRDVIPLLKKQAKDSGLVVFAQLEEYLKANNLMISSTDKNLGAAVITRDWFIAGCNSLLEDTDNYKQISQEEKTVILERTRSRIWKISGSEFLDDNLQLRGFLRSNCPEDPLQEPTVPMFYGIPKIHKTPTKMRPIVPCHSVMQGPAAKYVSKQLKPLVKERPYVLHGSKDLATKLAALSIPKGKKIFLVSGDIVAFYPNIPRELCVIRVFQLWQAKVGYLVSDEERMFFYTCLKIANGDLVFDFLDKHYLQLKGLAMGVHSSPDMANLYGAYDEESIFEHTNAKDFFLFFGRYIDDCLGVVTAETPEEALAIAQRIHYAEVEIVWSVSEWNTPFLDLLVYIDPSTNQVEHTPYRKALNHKERIPWASYHPKDVKKGTFLGEMSRLATLSSKLEHYTDAIDDLGSLYIARGYPVDLVHSWIKLNVTTRWNQRLGASKEDAQSVFVLKTKFNPVWHSFNVKELETLIIQPWRDYSTSVIWCDEPGCERPGHGWGPPPAVAKKRGASDIIVRGLGIDFIDVEEGPARKRIRNFYGLHVPVGESSAAEAMDRPVFGVNMPRVAVLCGSDTPSPKRLQVPEGPWSIMMTKEKPPLIGFNRKKEFDVRKADLLDRKLHLSRKRTRNLGDLTTVWNKCVLDKLTADSDVDMFLDAWV